MLCCCCCCAAAAAADENGESGATRGGMVVLVNVRGTLGDPLPTDFLLRLALKLWLEVSSRGSSS